MSNYVDPLELARLIRLAQAGDFGQRLYDVIALLVSELGGDEDVLQQVAMHLFQRLQWVNPDANVFAYISQMVIYEKKYQARTARNDVKKNRAFAFDVLKWVPLSCNGRRVDWHKKPHLMTK